MFGRVWNRRESSLIIVTLAVSALLNGGLWLAAILLFPRDEAGAVLHYSIDVGIDFIGEGKQIIVLPIIGAALAAGNVVLGGSLWLTNPLTAKLLIFVTPLLQLILLSSFILIWHANR